MFNLPRLAYTIKIGKIEELISFVRIKHKRISMTVIYFNQASSVCVQFYSLMQFIHYYFLLWHIHDFVVACEFIEIAKRLYYILKYSVYSPVYECSADNDIPDMAVCDNIKFSMNFPEWTCFTLHLEDTSTPYIGFRNGCTQKKSSFTSELGLTMAASNNEWFRLNLT